jgi:hypothetical protein
MWRAAKRRQKKEAGEIAGLYSSGVLAWSAILLN